MRDIVLLCTLLVSTAGLARDYHYEIEQAQRACAIEQGSQLKDRNGTPSCAKVSQLIQMQQMEQNADAQRERLKTEAEVSRETGQPMPSHNFTTVNSSVVNTTEAPPPAPIVIPGHIQARHVYDPETKKSCVVYTDNAQPVHCN